MSKTVPPNYLNVLLSSDQEKDTCVRKQRLKITHSFTIPDNDGGHESTGRQEHTQIGAFVVAGREVRKIPTQKSPNVSKATVIDSPFDIFKEYGTPMGINASQSEQADLLQEPRPPEDDCPESTSNFQDDSEDVVPSSQPNDYADDSATLRELNDLISRNDGRGKMTITDTDERERLFASSNRSSTSRVFDTSSGIRRTLRSDTNRYGLVNYSTTPEFPKSSQLRPVKRSHETQSGDDFFVDSPANRKAKAKRVSKTLVDISKIPKVPDDYDALLEELNFLKGKKQADETFGKLSIKGHDLYSLRPRTYVNDLIIDSYLKLICARSTTSTYRKSYAFGTFFWPWLNTGEQNLDKLVSWIKVDLFEHELLFLPINQENHWFLFVADLVNRNYFIYDSLHYGTYESEIETVVNFLKYYAEKRNHEIDWQDWSSAPLEEHLGPMQSNGVDCGVFLCQYVEHLSRRSPLDFFQAGMPSYRKRMMYELLNGELLPPRDESNNDDLVID